MFEGWVIIRVICCYIKTCRLWFIIIKFLEMWPLYHYTMKLYQYSNNPPLAYLKGTESKTYALIPCKVSCYTKTCRCWWLFETKHNTLSLGVEICINFCFPRGTLVIPCSFTDTPTLPVERSLGELNPRPHLWYHVRFFVITKPTDVDEYLKPSTRPYH